MCDDLGILRLHVEGSHIDCLLGHIRVWLLTITIVIYTLVYSTFCIDLCWDSTYLSLFVGKIVFAGSLRNNITILRGLLNSLQSLFFHKNTLRCHYFFFLHKVLLWLLTQHHLGSSLFRPSSQLSLLLIDHWLFSKLEDSIYLPLRVFWTFLKSSSLFSNETIFFRLNKAFLISA